MSIAGVDAEGWILGLSGALEPGDRAAFQQAAEAALAEQRCLCIMRPCPPRAYSGVGSPTSGGGGPRKFVARTTSRIRAELHPAGVLITHPGTFG